MGVFRKKKFDILALSATGTKGTWEDVSCGLKCVCAGVGSNENRRERVIVLMSDWWHGAMTDFVCVSTRIKVVKFKLEKGKVYVVETYDPSKDDVRESETFWIVWRMFWTRLVEVSDWLCCAIYIVE